MCRGAPGGEGNGPATLQAETSDCKRACWRKLISGTQREPQNLSEILPEFPKLQTLLLTYPGGGATLIGTDPDAMVRLARLGLAERKCHLRHWAEPEQELNKTT